MKISMFENTEQMWAAVEFMLDTPGWKGYIVPSLEELMRADMSALAAMRRGDVPDDFLRGRISLANRLLHSLWQELKEYKEATNNRDLLGPDGQPVSVGDPYGENPSDGQPDAK